MNNLSPMGCNCRTGMSENHELPDGLDHSDCLSGASLAVSHEVPSGIGANGSVGFFVIGGYGPSLFNFLPVTQSVVEHLFLPDSAPSDSAPSDALIDRHCALMAASMLLCACSAEEPELQFKSVEQAFAFWRDLASSQAEVPELPLLSHQAVDLLLFLEFLTKTVEYQNPVSRPVLAQRVMAVMALLAENEQIRSDALSCVNDAISSCDDRVLLALDELETLQSLTAAKSLAIEKNDPTELRSLGRQMMRLDEVKRIARDYVKNLSQDSDKVDEIEVELAFQIGVREHLDLPGSTKNMRYREYASISDQEMANAVDRVRVACSGTKLESYLEQWAPWQQYRRHQVMPAFEQLKLQVVDYIDECPIRMEKTDRMVMVDNIQTDYGALRLAYLENGLNPFTHIPLKWGGVVRLMEAVSPNDT